MNNVTKEEYAESFVEMAQRGQLLECMISLKHSETAEKIETVINYLVEAKTIHCQLEC